MKELKFSIGDYVIVSTTMFREKSGDRITWLKSHFSIPRLGQVVGLCTRYDGLVEGGYNYDESGGPSYFVPSKAHQFWLVRFGLINKPVHVADEDIRLATVDDVEALPFQYPRQKMSERDKKNLSVDSENWPRDSKGRWVAGPDLLRSQPNLAKRRLASESH